MEDPFDLGAGGTALTWATQESMLIQNPALLPFGETTLRWVGYKANIAPGLDSLQLIQKLAQGDAVVDAEDPLDMLETFETPAHLGVAAALSLITNNAGLAAYASSAPDARYWPRGNPTSGTGIPDVAIRNETYAGVHGSAATQLKPWFAVGASLKHLQVQESLTQVELTDPEGLSTLSETFQDIFNQQNTGSGMGLDVGSLFFFQGEHVDSRCALAVSNLGSLKLTNAQVLPQMVHVGVGLTLHSEADALHLAADVRDVTRAATEEPDYKRLHLGARLMLRRYVGAAIGLYHGSPTYGAEVDLILLRLAVATYQREYGTNPGVDPRRIVVVSLRQGISF